MKKRYEVTWVETREIVYREYVWADNEVEAIELADPDTADEIDSRTVKQPNGWRAERAD